MHNETREAISQWRDRTPVHASAGVAEKAVMRCFGPSSVSKTGGSHQFRIKHRALRGQPGFGDAGFLSIPVKDGRWVKGYYLRRIAQAIFYLEEIGELQE